MAPQRRNGRSGERSSAPFEMRDGLTSYDRSRPLPRGVDVEPARANRGDRRAHGPASANAEAALVAAEVAPAPRGQASPMPDVRGVLVTFFSKETGPRVCTEIAEADARLRRALPELADRDRRARDAGADAIEQALRQMRAARGFPPFT